MQSAIRAKTNSSVYLLDNSNNVAYCLIHTKKTMDNETKDGHIELS